MADDFFSKPVEAKPRNVDDWMKLWKVPEEKVLLEGDKTFPDIHQRQRHLVGVTVDAAIILYIYEKLKSGKSVAELGRFFNAEVTPEEVRKLEGTSNEARISPEVQKEHEEACVKLLAHMADMHRIPKRSVGYIFEKLKEGKSPEELVNRRSLPPRLSKDETAILKTVSDENKVSPDIQKKRDEERMELLIQMAKKHRILGRSVLAEEKEAFDTRTTSAVKYDDTKSREKKDGVASIAWLSEKKDPGILAARELPAFGSVCSILDPLPKTYESIQRKKKEKKKSASELTDLNRIAVLPTSPEYRDDFNKIMTLLHPPKKVWMTPEQFNEVRQKSFPGAPKAEGSVEVIIPQVFVQPPQVFKHGYFSQMTLVAIDRRRSGKDGEMLTTKNNEATIAEIKSAPLEMEMAEEMTGILKVVYKNLKSPSLFTRGGMDDRRIALKSSHQKAKSAFDSALKSAGIQAQGLFPPGIGSSNENDRDSYVNLHKALLLLKDNLPEPVAQSPAAVQAIETLTGLVRNPDLFVNKGTETRRTNLLEQYDTAKAQYEKRLGRMNSMGMVPASFKLPFFGNNPEKLEDADTYRKLQDAIARVQANVNIAAMTAESPEWRREFIARALYQNLYVESGSKIIEKKTGEKRQMLKGFGRAEKLAEADLPRFDTTQTPVLESIARGTPEEDIHSRKPFYPNALPYKDIENEVRLRFSRAQWNLPGVSGGESERT